MLGSSVKPPKAYIGRPAGNVAEVPPPDIARMLRELLMSGGLAALENRAQNRRFEPPDPNSRDAALPRLIEVPRCGRISLNEMLGLWRSAVTVGSITEGVHEGTDKLARLTKVRCWALLCAILLPAGTCVHPMCILVRVTRTLTRPILWRGSRGMQRAAAEPPCLTTSRNRELR